MGLLEKPPKNPLLDLVKKDVPAGQKSNWANNLIPHFVKRLKEWSGGELTETEERNYQYANLLINNKIFPELCRLVWPDTGRRKCPFPQDIALAFEWVLAKADEVPETKAKCTNFPFIYRNFVKIMKKEKTK